MHCLWFFGLQPPPHTRVVQLRWRATSRPPRRRSHRHRRRSRRHRHCRQWRQQRQVQKSGLVTTPDVTGRPTGGSAVGSCRGDGGRRGGACLAGAGTGPTCPSAAVAFANVTTDAASTAAVARAPPPVPPTCASGGGAAGCDLVAPFLTPPVAPSPRPSAVAPPTPPPMPPSYTSDGRAAGLQLGRPSPRPRWAHSLAFPRWRVGTHWKPTPWPVRRPADHRKGRLGGPCGARGRHVRSRNRRRSACMSCLMCGGSLLSFELTAARGAGCSCCLPNFWWLLRSSGWRLPLLYLLVLLLHFWMNVMLLFPLSSFLLTLLLLQLFLLLF